MKDKPIQEKNKKMKKKRINKEQEEAIIDKELGVTADVEATGRPRE